MFDALDTQGIVNLIGGAIILFFLGWQVVEKAFGNIDWIKGKKAKREKEHTEKREKEIKDFIEEVIVPPILEEIETINNGQNLKLDNLIRSTNDTMRVELLKTYFKYRSYKKIPQWAKEAAAHIYEDYTTQEGNSFVEDLWSQMSTWEVVPSEEDLKEE